MRRSGAAVRRMGRAVKSAAGLVAKLGLAAGAVALGGLALILKANLKSIDSLAKLSRNLGISIDKIQGLRMAAEIAGVGSDKLEKSLKKLTTWFKIVATTSRLIPNAVMPLAAVRRKSWGVTSFN